MLPNLSLLADVASPTPLTFAPKKEHVNEWLYGAFGPSDEDDASDEEKEAWKAWKEAVDRGASKNEVARLRNALQKLINARLQAVPRS